MNWLTKDEWKDRKYVVAWSRKNGDHREQEVDENGLLKLLGYIMQAGGKIDTVKHVV